MSGFVLSGQDLQVDYSTDDDTLTVQGGGLPLGDGPFTFSGSEIARSASPDGDTLTVVLLESSRNGTQVRLNVLVPQCESSETDLPITAAAMVVTDLRNVLSGPPPVHHKYDVRSMTGTSRA